MSGNTVNQSDTSDSEDENLEKLREAANNEFINDTMFNKNIKPKDKKNIEKPLVSLRRQDFSNLHDNDFHVTPEFQHYVGKHLSRVLDSQLKEKRRKSAPIVKKEPAGGVKLFKNSTDFITVNADESSTIPKSKKYKRKKSDSSSSNSDAELNRCAEAAVSTEWILNKEGTKGWVKSKKGKEVTINGKGKIMMEKD